MKSESQEQIELMTWTKRNVDSYPGIELIFAIPNGGARHIATASRLKLEGVKAGVPDLFLPVAKRDFHGLFIELKKAKGGNLSKTQKQWRDDLREQGYAWVRANGAEHAINIIKGYYDDK